MTLAAPSFVPPTFATAAVLPTPAPVAALERLGDAIAELAAHLEAASARLLALIREFDARGVMRHDAEGHPVEVGARTRTIPPALRRALQYRDQGCRFPGCGGRHGQGHHLRHWAQGGPTTLSNLTMLCRRHHRAVHEEGYGVERGPDGTLQFRWPDGRLFPAVPPPPAVPAEPVAALRAHHHAQGLALARGQRAHNGWGSGSIWAGPSGSYIREPTPAAAEPAAGRLVPRLHRGRSGRAGRLGNLSVPPVTRSPLRTGSARAFSPPRPAGGGPPP